MWKIGGPQNVDWNLNYRKTIEFVAYDGAPDTFDLHRRITWVGVDSFGEKFAAFGTGNETTSGFILKNYLNNYTTNQPVKWNIVDDELNINEGISMADHSKWDSFFMTSSAEVGAVVNF